MEFECKRCGTVVEILDCDRPTDSQELYCMDCFKIKKQFSVGVIVQFIDGRPEEVFGDITNTDWNDGFIHLSIEIECAKYNKEGGLIKKSELNTVASFNQDVVFSVTDIKPKE